MKIVTAIILTISLERVVKALQHIGINGMTISEIKETGEQVRLYDLILFMTELRSSFMTKKRTRL